MHRLGPLYRAIGGRYRHGTYASHMADRGLHRVAILGVSHTRRDGDWKGVGGADDVFGGPGAVRLGCCGE